MTSLTYLVAGCKPWNRRHFEQRVAHLPGRWHFVGAREEFTSGLVEHLQPRYIFFLHWSWKVPADVVRRYECVCFHMTDVPYGRGGSPLQNLIVRGHRETQMTALRMEEELDAGPVYLKRALSLEGGGEEVLLRASELSLDMVQWIVREQPQPQPQVGPATTFKRRTPPESQIPSLATLPELHDFVRMLDAEGYPRAFLEHGGFRYEFSRASLYDGRIIADVKITPISATTPAAS